MVTAADRRCVAHWSIKKHELSERQAGRLFGISRCALRYQAKPRDDSAIEAALRLLAEQHRRWGFEKMFDRLRLDGHRWNHKRVRRVYRNLKLHLRVKPKKRVPSRNPQPLAVPDEANVCWSADFMSDALTSGKRFRTLNIIDDYNRQALWIEVDTSLPSKRVEMVLDRLSAERGRYPKFLRSDNGSEFIANRLSDWAERHGVVLDFIEPGKPAQNAYIERFNRTFREDVLDAYLFESVDEAQTAAEQWLDAYNRIRPHEALNGQTPLGYAQTQKKSLL